MTAGVHEKINLGAKMKTIRQLVVMLFCILAIGNANAQTKKFNAAEAKDHIGERATVCGKVVSVHFAGRSKGQPTFMNLDEPYPRQIFTIVIWSSDRPKFGDPESKYRDFRVCSTGKITQFRGGNRSIAPSGRRRRASPANGSHD
jgi:hypothetical protein